MATSPLHLITADDDPSDARLQAEAAYWDAVIQGRDAATAEIDPTLRHTIDALYALDATLPPAQTFVANLEATLLGRHPSFTSSLPELAITSAVDDDPPGQCLRLARQWERPAGGGLPRQVPPSLPPSVARPVVSDARTGRLPWSISSLATGVLLLATLCLLIVTLGASRGLVIPRQALQDRLPLAANPSGLDLVLPRELLPPTNPAVASLSDYTLPAGVTTTWDAADGACCPGLRLLTVLEGALTVRPAGASSLVRSPDVEPSAPLLPGAPLTLQPGDTLLLPYDEAFSSSNTGPTETRFLDVLVLAGFAPLRTAPSGWVWHPDSDIATTLTLPDGPVTLRLEQVELEAGAVLLPPSQAITQLGITVADNLPLQIQDADEIANRTAHPVTVTVVTLTDDAG